MQEAADLAQTDLVRAHAHTAGPRQHLRGLGNGGMFTVIKARRGLDAADFRDPGWYRAPANTVARVISEDRDFGSPPRRSRS
jgi:hypothetical protein